MTEEMDIMAGSYCIVTYGCQMNEHDSEIMAGLLEDRGYSRIEAEQGADIVIFNTCTVRDGAEHRALSRAQAISAAKLRSDDSIVIVSGCVAQDQGTALLERLPQIDMVIGTRDYVRLPELIERYRVDGERIVAVEDIAKPLAVDTIPVRRNKLRAFTNIMYGCNNRCTFCIVPKTRGEEWSRPIGDIVEEVKRLVNDGTREVTVLGQNVNSYMTEKREDFADLLYALNEIDGLWRIRYTTSNPKSCRDRHINVVADCEKVMENLHLPVQSGDDRVLRVMKRAYNTKRYRYIVDLFRERNPLHSLTTDIIVGFPSETREEFDNTLNLVKEMRYDSAFMFMYSPRAGTPAAEMPNDVSLAEKKARLKELIDLQEEISIQKNQEEIGRTHEILVEGPARKSPGHLQGRTRTDKMVVFQGQDRLVGQTAKVEITGGSGHSLLGKVLTRESEVVQSTA